jgi:hypothetical protein
MLCFKGLSRKITLYLFILVVISVNGQDVVNTVDSVSNMVDTVNSVSNSPEADSSKISAMPANTKLATETQTAQLLKTVVKIQKNKNIVGAYVKDIDNDTKNEMIILYRQSVEVARLVNKTLQTIAEFKAPTGVAFISIDVADINGNGANEFYISAVNATFEIYQSMVLEFSSGKFAILKKRCGYQFRVVNEVDGRSTLLGQKYSSGGVQKGDLFVMGLDGGELVEKNRIGISDRAVHSVTCLCDRSDSTSVYAVTAHDGFIEILDRQSGSKIAESSDKFGGSPIAIKLPSHSLSNPAMSAFPIRNVSFDYNNDGVDELVCVKNKDTFSNLLASTRMYKKTHFEILSFNKNEGLIDNNGKDNIIVIKLDNAENKMFKKARTEIIVLE